MSYSKLRDEMLRALYEGQRSDPTAEFWSFKDLADIYDMDWQPGWLIELQRELRDEGLIRGPSNGQNDDMAVGRLSGAGMRSIEQKYGTLKGVPALITRRGELPVDEALRLDDAVSVSTVDDVALAAHDPSVSSVSWTGIERRLASSPRVVDEIRIKIEELDVLVEQTGLTNLEKRKAKAITEALVKLVQSPEPEWEAIVKLLTSAPLTALLNVTALTQLIVTLVLSG